MYMETLKSAYEDRVHSLVSRKKKKKLVSRIKKKEIAF